MTPQCGCPCKGCRTAITTESPGVPSERRLLSSAYLRPESCGSRGIFEAHSVLIFSESIEKIPPQRSSAILSEDFSLWQNRTLPQCPYRPRKLKARKFLNSPQTETPRNSLGEKKCCNIFLRCPSLFESHAVIHSS